MYLLFCSLCSFLLTHTESGGAALWADKISMEDSSEEQVEASDSIEKAIRLNETKEEISKDSEEIRKQELLPLTESQEGENILTGLVDLKEELTVFEEVIENYEGTYYFKIHIAWWYVHYDPLMMQQKEARR